MQVQVLTTLLNNLPISKLFTNPAFPEAEPEISFWQFFTNLTTVAFDSETVNYGSF